jgi:hypothetical protein
MMKAYVFIILNGCLLFTAACKKDNEEELQNIPDQLFGSWAYHEEETWPVQDVGFFYKFKMTDVLHGSYEFLWQEEYPVENNIVSPGAEKGSFVISNDRIMLTATDFGSQMEIGTGDLLDSISWYTEDDTEFQVFESMGSMLYRFDGDTLVLFDDFEGDGIPDYETPFIRENWTMPE